MVTEFDFKGYTEERDNDPTRQATGYSGRLWPNGEFTLGYVPPKRHTEKEKRFNADWSNQYEWIEREYDPQWRGFEGLMAWRWHQELVRVSDLVCQRRITRVLPESGGRLDVLIVTYGVLKPHGFESDLPESQDAQQGSPIGLSPLHNSHNVPEGHTVPAPRRGGKGITGYGKRMIRNSAEMMQQVYGRRRLGFLTLTLPSFDDPFNVQLLAHDFAELMRAAVQEIMREIGRAGGPQVYSGCIELQEKRYRTHGDVAPHLHLVYVAHPGNYDWYVTAAKIREIWARCIKNRLEYWGCSGEFEIGAAVDCQVVKASAAAYLAKYLSKGGKILEDLKNNGDTELIPTAWYTVCNSLKKAVKGLTTELGSDIKRSIIQGVDLVRSGFCQWLFKIEIEIDGETFSRGWVGKIAGQSINPLQVMPYLEGT